MDIHRQKAEELRTQCRQLKEQLASLAAEKLELGAAAPSRIRRCSAATRRSSTRSVRWPGWSSRKTPLPWRKKNILDKLWGAV